MPRLATNRVEKAAEGYVVEACWILAMTGILFDGLSDSQIPLQSLAFPLPYASVIS